MHMQMNKPLEIIFKRVLLTTPNRIEYMLPKLQKPNLQVQYKIGFLVFFQEHLRKTSSKSNNGS